MALLWAVAFNFNGENNKKLKKENIVDEYSYKRLGELLKKYVHICGVGMIDENCLHKILAISLHAQGLTGMCTELTEDLLNGYYNEIDKTKYYQIVKGDGNRHWGA